MLSSRLLPLLTIMLVAPLLGGCSSGADDTAPYKASIGSNERTESTDALGFAIVVDGKGNGRVVGTLLNSTDEPQALVGANVDTERGPATAAVIEDRLALPPDEPVELAREPAIDVSAPDLPVGYFVELTLDIKGGETIEMLVPVEAQKGPYAEIEVTEPPDGRVAP